MLRNTIINSLIITGFLVSGHRVLTAQEDTVTLSGIIDSSSVSRPASSHSLYSGAGYGSNMIYMGSTISNDMPYYYGSLTWGFKDELFATISAYKLSAFKNLPAFYNVSLYYTHVFNSWFDISMGISRYQVAQALSDTLFSSFLYGDVTLGIDWKLIYSQFSAGGIFSEGSTAYFDFRNSRYFQTSAFFNNKMYISFDPYADLLFGTLTKITTADGTSTGISPPFNKGKPGGNNSSSPTTTYSTSFGLLEASMGLPVGFNTGHITLEAEPGYIIPLYSEGDFQSPAGFVFLLSCYVKFF